MWRLLTNACQRARVCEFEAAGAAQVEPQPPHLSTHDPHLDPNAAWAADDDTRRVRIHLRSAERARRSSRRNGPAVRREPLRANRIARLQLQLVRLSF
jgi:hypothetical protein